MRGGFDVPAYLGSRATFTLGKFGGHGGRALLPGDVLHLGERRDAGRCRGAIPAERAAADRRGVGDRRAVRPARRAGFFHRGGHRARSSRESWEVHYNSSRTGVRLIGPKPKWARSDGGEAGLHPSNIHDNAYAIGTVDFTGDMPVILGPDGPSLGGFVCPVTVVRPNCGSSDSCAPNDRDALQAAVAGARLPQAERAQER